MIFCQHCGAQNQEGNSNCVQCGAALNAGNNAGGFSNNNNYQNNNSNFQNNNYQNQGGYNPNYQQNNYQPPVVDNGGCGWMILGGIFPLIGLILFLMWKDTRPKTAKSAGLGALIMFIVDIVFIIIYVAIIVPLVLDTINTYSSLFLSLLH